MLSVSLQTYSGRVISVWCRKHGTEGIHYIYCVRKKQEIIRPCLWSIFGKPHHSCIVIVLVDEHYTFVLNCDLNSEQCFISACSVIHQSSDLFLNGHYVYGTGIHQRLCIDEDIHRIRQT